MKLSKGIELYIQMRQEEGLSYLSEAAELRSFGRYVGGIEIHEVTTLKVLAFLDHGNICTMVWRRRRAQLSRFFRHWLMLGVTFEIHMPPPRGIARRTFTPYVYTHEEVRALIDACVKVPDYPNCMLAGETLRALLLLLYGTGVRMSEALHLLESDVDLKAGTLRLFTSRTRTFRVIPIGIPLQRILRAYARWKRKSGCQGAFFFLRRDGTRLSGPIFRYRFQKIVAMAGVARRDGTRCAPRIFDLRVTFAVRQITSWIRGGKDLNRLLPALSGYLGNVRLEVSEQFLAVTPERFKKELDRLSPEKGKGWVNDAELMKLLPTL